MRREEREFLMGGVEKTFSRKGLISSLKSSVLIYFIKTSWSHLVQRETQTPTKSHLQTHPLPSLALKIHQDQEQSLFLVLNSMNGVDGTITFLGRWTFPPPLHSAFWHRCWFNMPLQQKRSFKVGWVGAKPALCLPLPPSPSLPPRAENWHAFCWQTFGDAAEDLSTPGRVYTAYGSILMQWLRDQRRATLGHRTIRRV